MTVEEFKKQNPKYKDTEGDQLWDAMTDLSLRQQKGSEIIKVIKPIYKTHTLRWLFYRRKNNFTIPGPRYDKWTANKRCSKCKWGVNYRMGWIINNVWTSNCPHCGKEYVGEPNTNLTYRMFLLWKFMSKYFWFALDKLHLVRSSSFTRYDMFGDEMRYVRSWITNINTGKSNVKLKSRKWWEYILIEKPFHNF